MPSPYPSVSSAVREITRVRSAPPAASPGGRRERRTSLRFACVLGATLLCLAGCSSKPEPSPRETAHSAFEDLRTALRKDVADPARRDALIARADELESLVAEAAADQRGASERIAALNRSYDATEPEFLAVFGALNQKRAERHRKLVEIHAEVRTLATEEEWKHVSRFKKLALEAVYEASTQAETTP